MRSVASRLAARWDVLVVIAVGGALGSLARWALTVAMPHDPEQLPWATWVANTSGAFALGLLMVFLLDVWPPNRHWRPFVATGVLGGYTTFSTAMLDTRNLLAADRPGLALAYLFGSLATLLLAVWAGTMLARLGVAGIERRHVRRRERAAPGNLRGPTAAAPDESTHPSDVEQRSRG